MSGIAYPFSVQTVHRQPILYQKNQAKFMSKINRTILILSFGLLAHNTYATLKSHLTFSIDSVFSLAELTQNNNYPVPDKYPRTLNKKGEIVTTKLNDWTEGFFPGTLWYIYENNKQAQWKEIALKWTLPMEKLKYLTSHHDVGFLMYCGYGNAYRLAPQPEYEAILIQSAKSLATRFSNNTKCIKSWDYRESWDGKHKWYYPVIIDNMMNLELMYFAAEKSGDKQLYDIATTHAQTTAKNHFRNDFSSYHVVNYEPKTGDVLFKGTCQGYADNSTWARGQAWAIYGFTMTYRFTKQKSFLKLAESLAKYWLKSPSMPADGIPYWDFNSADKSFKPADWALKRPAPAIQPRDASAAAVSCSAFLELYEFTHSQKYLRAAEKILNSLASDAYLAKAGTNGNFLLKHSVGSLPHGAEIDVPLTYADYYFLEALHRYRNLKLK